MTRLLGIGAGVMAALVCAACGPAVETGSGGNGGTTSNSGTTSTGLVCQPDFSPCCAPGQMEPCCHDQCTTSSTTTGTGMGVGGTTTTSTTTTGTGMGGAGGGTTCGGFAGTPCAADEFCKFADERCGGNDNSGVCTKRPVGGCADYYQATCACDGKVYNNPCDANGHGTDVNDGASCTAPTGTFGCGAHFCAAGMEYCQMNGSDVANVPSTFQCQPLPASCGAAASCACLAGVPCGGQCMATPNGGLQITCPGG